MIRAMRTLLLVLAAGCSAPATMNTSDADLAQTQPRDLASQPAADLAMAAPDMAMATVGATVVLKDDFYMPSMVSINAGQKVKWSWQAAGAHGVDSVDNAFPDSPILNSSNTSYEHTFTTPGTYQVQCLVHGTAMPMTIVVK